MILLALIFFALAAFGCVLLIRQPMIATRAAAIAVLPIVAFAVWQAAQPPTGWPAHAAPPKAAEFQWAVVREPEPGDRGEIDLWLTPPDSSRPRVYRIPYTRQLHKQVQAATRAAKGGLRVGVRRLAKRGGAYSKARFVFYRLPPAMPPAKP